MTDIMKLIDDVIDYNASDERPRAALQSAIEALQAENERFAKELDAAQEEINCAESALEAFSCEFEAEVFNQGFDCLGDFVQALWKASNGQRDALQAKLDELQRQEPVLFIHPSTFSINSAHVGAWKPGYELAGYLPLFAFPAVPKGASAATQLHAMATNYPAGHLWDKLDAQACIRGALEIEALRAAPKALEPLTRKQIDDLAEEGVYFGNIYEITREIELAHGITKGTP